MNSLFPSGPSDIVLVSGADENYAMPLAVTIRSVMEHLPASEKVKLFILDGGISSATRERLRRSWDDPRIQLQWLAPDVSRIADLPVSDHISSTAYLRLMLPELLGPEIDRAIYLDADMLVRRDLRALWDEPLNDHLVLAVQDFAAPFIDASRSMSNFIEAKPYLSAVHPVANHAELGLDRDAMYFNSGLLVMNLKQWRSENITDKVLACLDENRPHVLWWDQYALNVVCAGRWRCLDRRWNQGAHIFEYRSWRESPFEKQLYDQLQSDPWIVHYCSPLKPWHYFSNHPFENDFWRVLSQTAWQGYRPDRPEEFLRRWWKHHYKPIRQRFKGTTRRFKDAFRRDRIAA